MGEGLADWSGVSRSLMMRGEVPGERLANPAGDWLAIGKGNAGVEVFHATQEDKYQLSGYGRQVKFGNSGN